MYYRKNDKVVSSVEHYVHESKCSGVSVGCIISIFILLIMILFPIFFKNIQELLLNNKLNLGVYAFSILLLFIVIIFTC